MQPPTMWLQLLSARRRPISLNCKRSSMVSCVRRKLAAQLAIRAISKASEAYKRDKSIQPFFQSEGAIVYDPRVMSFKGLNTVSLLTLSGRVLVPFRMGEYQESRLDQSKGQADLIYRQGIFYLAATLEVPTPAPHETSDTLGV